MFDIIIGKAIRSTQAIEKVYSRLKNDHFLCHLCLSPLGDSTTSEPIDSSLICSECHKWITFPPFACRQCGLPSLLATDHCGRCIQEQPAYDLTLAGSLYKGPMTQQIRRFKSKGTSSLIQPLLAPLADKIRTEYPPAMLSQLHILPVPTSTRRWLRRGFNPTHQLVQTLIQSQCIPEIARTQVYWRALSTAKLGSQKGRQRSARKTRNAQQFQLSSKKLEVLAPHVVLVDDVMTTGATLNACAQRLKQAGTQRVDCWVLARTP